ncbi:HU family DNA-binding protein [Odoribacter splanchnicus]|uniref:HU family DNA-binding protein n=1 Tax=Odoribacter splanchnicus TaxID=28118 RepID=UPI00232EE0F7|nr:HU family DNA-binding protein [Odoribacter splanchnicus]MDB9246393.1 HU family DNA-binding protein [Odoribacter splanchnicus]
MCSTYRRTDYGEIPQGQDRSPQKIEGKNVYLRGFGSFVVKKRAEKTARNISKNVTIKIPEHFIPSFKPSKSFVNDVKGNVKK